jgi:hypothetical protein
MLRITESSADAAAHARSWEMRSTLSTDSTRSTPERMRTDRSRITEARHAVASQRSESFAIVLRTFKVCV